jgi:hypothetical protein
VSVRTPPPITSGGGGGPPRAPAPGPPGPQPAATAAEQAAAAAGARALDATGGVQLVQVTNRYYCPSCNRVHEHEGAMAEPAEPPLLGPQPGGVLAALAALG